MYVALVPDAYMDYLETTYSTTRREVKSMMQDYFKYWNKNYGTDGRMSYDIGKTEEITDAAKVKELLKRQVYSSVRWQQTIENMIADGVDTFIEVGPGKTLTGFMKKINREVKSINIATVDDLAKLEELNA